MTTNIIRTFRQGILFLLFICVLYPSVDGQIIIDPELANLFESPAIDHSAKFKPLQESDNEINITLGSLFLIYKSFFSSQDIPRCIFTPSCSEYAIESFQKKGLISGWLSTFDRLTRCHGFAKHDHYPFDTKKGRFYDPVQ